MSTQTDNLRLYAQAYLATGEAAYLKSAEQIHSYLRHFLLSPEGGFYVSQDADLHPGEHSAEYFQLDDAQRRKLGVPRIDHHLYARENGWAIRSFCKLYAATDDLADLGQAIAAADWVIKNRSIGDGALAGGFRHDEKDLAGPYLGDTLAMGDAFLALYQTTADRAWLGRAGDCMKFIRANFASHDAGGNAMGLSTAAISGDSALPAPKPEVDENIAAARFANLLYVYTGAAEDRELASAVMRYLAAPEISKNRGWAVGGILLADRELNSQAMHVTVVAAKSNAIAAELFQTALRAPVHFKRIDWYDAAEGKLPNTDVDYPTLPYPAAFLCSGTACSSPMKTPAALARKLKLATTQPAS